MENTQVDQAKMKLKLVLAKHKIIDDAAVEATIQKILETTPAAVKEKMKAEGATETEIALQMADSYFAAEGGNKEPDPTEKTKHSSTKPATANMTAEDRNAIQEYFDSNAVATEKRTAQTRVVRQLTDKPTMAVLHVDGAKLKPSKSDSFEAKFKEYEGSLVDTTENRRKFVELKAAVDKGEELEVYVNTEAKEKVIGWVIETLDENMQPTTQVLTKETAQSFLVLSVAGYIAQRGENSIGLKIRWTSKTSKSAAKNNEADGASRGSTSVAVTNAKAIKDNRDLSECTSIILTEGGVKQINDTQSARSAMYFEIYTGKTNAKGEKTVRKVRVSGKTKAYRVVRKEEYVSVMGPAEGKKSTGTPNKNEMQKIQEMRVASMYSMSVNSMDPRVKQAKAELERSKRQASPKDFH